MSYDPVRRNGRDIAHLAWGEKDMTNVIEFQDFSFTYRSQSEPTLRQIQLTIQAGERILIVGPSGSGKSTLAQCIKGPFSYPGTWKGQDLIKGQDAQTLLLFDRSLHIATVLQDPDAQFVGLSVGEDVAFALENKQTGRPEMHEIVERVARMTDVETLLQARLNDLSAGQRQRAALAGVLVEDADVLLFDEPLANLDPLAGQEAMVLMD
jgi:energy-coupling factor transport system ATP-binding protein